MAFDFPASPTVGQSVTTLSGSIFTWDGVKWTAAGIIPVYNDVGRNTLHNSMFNITQRGAGLWTASGYTADRWATAIIAPDTASFSQVGISDADRAVIGDEAAQYALQNVFTGNAAAGAFNLVQQKIENIRRLSGKTVTASFWAKASAAGLKLGVSIDQLFGTGGTPSAAVVGAGTAVSLTTAWARYSVTLNIASISGLTLGTNSDHSTNLDIWFSSGATNATRAGSIGVQSGTIQLWGVQLEIGSVATPLEKPDPQVDLAKCQRFYIVLSHLQFGNYTLDSNPFWNSYTLPVMMRASPTMTFLNISYGSSSGLTSDGTTQTSISMHATRQTGSSGACFVSTDTQLNADL